MGEFQSFIGVDFWTALFTFFNMLITFAVLKKFLFKPVKQMIDDRQNEIDSLFAIIRELKSEGITILLIEQNANAALRCADTGLVLETGRITLHGTGAELLVNYAVKAAYLGT